MSGWGCKPIPNVLQAPGGKGFVYDLDNILKNPKDGICTVRLSQSRGIFWDPEETDRKPFNKTPFDFTLNKERSLAFVCHTEGDAISVVNLAQKAAYVLSKLIFFGGVMMRMKRPTAFGFASAAADRRRMVFSE